ncbi:DUF4386 domain-containing protein [Planktotalea sp.]|uniref:DUF4386 domain-containing protein n=1 Tax=Planktotalea sp. TaxID=2029877 RepID=UPI003D6B999A
MLNINDTQSQGYARLAGLFYLTIAVAGGFSIAYVPSQIQVAGDGTATVANLIERQSLFHLGILGDAVVMLAEVMVSVMLFFMFRSVNATLSLAAAIARVMMVAVMASMLFFYAGALYLATAEGALIAFPEPQRVEWVMLMLHLNSVGVWIWQLFFTLHLLLLGSLVVRSGAFPKWLGYGLMIGGLGYILDSAYASVLTDQAWLGNLRIGLLVIVTLSEISFALMLAIFGRNPAR